jgi:hypothetical protein
MLFLVPTALLAQTPSPKTSAPAQAVVSGGPRTGGRLSSSFAMIASELMATAVFAVEVMITG